MKKWFFILPILIYLFSAGNSAAQELPIINTLEIDLWPEYDRPELLVIYRVELSTEVSPPVTLSFRIPVEAGEPHAVAVRDPNGGLLNAPYERTVTGERAIITLTATMPGIQLEYYDPQIQINNTHREFQYTWPGDYTVESMSIMLQQPYNTSQVKISPPQAEIKPGAEGMNYHTIELGNQPMGVSTIISVEYVKEGDALSVESLPPQPISSINNNITGRMNVLDYVPWGLSFLGILLLTGGIYWYRQWGRRQPKPKIKRSRRRSTIVPTQSSSNDEGITYCHQCGKRASQGDRYCRACGTKLRRA